MVSDKENLHLSHGGPSQRQASYVSFTPESSLSRRPDPTPCNLIGNHSYKPICKQLECHETRHRQTGFCIFLLAMQCWWKQLNHKPNIFLKSRKCAPSKDSVLTWIQNVGHSDSFNKEILIKLRTRKIISSMQSSTFPDNIHVNRCATSGPPAIRQFNGGPVFYMCMVNGKRT